MGMRSPDACEVSMESVMEGARDDAQANRMGGPLTGVLSKRAVRARLVVRDGPPAAAGPKAQHLPPR